MTLGPASGRIDRAGRVLLAFGCVTGTVGVIGLAWFVVYYAMGRGFRTTDQLARAAALPHILTVIGIGLLVYGLVLRRRARTLFEERGV
jgi:hypothetical protein